MELPPLRCAWETELRLHRESATGPSNDAEDGHYRPWGRREGRTPPAMWGRRGQPEQQGHRGHHILLLRLHRATEGR
jgi:hypothetical protein